jgi:hypothetical protein
MRWLLLVLLLVGCDPVGVEHKVCCFRDSEGRVWTNPRLMELHEKGRLRLSSVRHPGDGPLRPDVMTEPKDIRRWCSSIH